MDENERRGRPAGYNNAWATDNVKD